MTKSKKSRYLSCIIIAIFAIIAFCSTSFAATSAENGGPIRLVYDWIGHYSINYTGNTNNYDYWNSIGSKKLFSRNYKDREDIETTNNSSATLSHSDSQSTIKKAYLVWETRAEEGVTDAIVLITPNNKAKGITADMSCKDTRTNNAGQKYTGVYCMAADVTSIVCGADGGYGTYTVANIPVWDGADDVACGGESVASWQLVVIEESPNFSVRTVSLNMMSQYYDHAKFTTTVDFSATTRPNGEVGIEMLYGDVDVTSDTIYDLFGTGTNQINGIYYTYKTPARGLYKNGVCINDRDQGVTDGYTDGGVRVHWGTGKFYNNTDKFTYTNHYENTAAGMFLFGAAVDIFTYDIRFDGNSATSGSMDNITCIYGRDNTLPANKYARDSYTFVGWNTKPDGSGTDYEDKAYIYNLTDSEEEVVLYAQWEPVIYDIQLDNQYATDAGTTNFYEWYGKGNYADCDCSTPIAQITIPKKTGYFFGGYYTGKNGTGTQYVDTSGNILSTPTTFTSDTRLYAKWTPAVYKITLDNQGANTAGTAEYYEKFNIGNYTTSACTISISKITNPTRSCHIFQGYYTEKNGEGQRIIDASGNIVPVYTMFAEDTTLYAYWKPNTYTITLDNQDATSTGTKAYYEKYGIANYIDINTSNSALGAVTQTYNYTGSVQAFVAPYTGIYTVKTWGAQGGGDASEAGKGGYSVGTVTLKEGDILYIYVGGQGSVSGGYNGGGAGGSGSAVGLPAGTAYGGGGGATDIRLGGKALGNRIIVAGGGGGTFYYDGNYTSNDAGEQVYLRGGYGNGTSSAATSIPQQVYFMYRAIYGGGETGIAAEDRTYPNLGWTNALGTPSGTPASISSTNGAPAGYMTGRTNSNAIQYTADNTSFSLQSAGGLGYGGINCGGGYYGGSQYKGAAVGIQKYSTWYTQKEYCNIYMAGYGGSGYIGGVSNGSMQTGVRTGNGMAQISYTKYDISVKETTSITIPKKTGYIFGGYYTGKNGTGTQYVDAAGNILSSPTTFTANTTLYAKWTASSSNTYQIAFHGNGADGGKMGIMTCAFNTNYTLLANQFTKTGYTFAGWSLTSNGGVAYGNKATVYNLSTVKGDVVTLYAKWTAGKALYTVNHYTEALEGGWSLHSTESKSGTTDSSVSVAGLKKSITGFNYDHAEVKGAAVTSAAIAADGSLAINLYYTRNSYTVTLNKGTGIDTVSGAGTYKYEERVKIDAGVLTGYAWSGWTGTYNAADKAYEFAMPARDVTLTANAVVQVYKITLDNQRATEMGTTEYYQKYSVGNYSDSACTTSVSQIVLPKKTGYIFDGYYTGKNGRGTQYIDVDGKILASSTTFTADTTLYACWIPITYIIRFEGNGATDGSMSDFTCQYDAYCQLPFNAFTRTHYSFIAWNTEPDGTGMTYVDGSYVEKLVSEPNGVITLYAQWTPNKYTVHFDANGGEGSMEDIDLTYDLPENLPLNAFTKENGYGPSIFKGWNLVPDTQEILYRDGEEVQNITENDSSIVTLYAIWDDCPWITAEDLYYTLEQAQSGFITYDELMSHAVAEDREDGSPIPPGVNEELGTSFKIIDYQPSDFTQFQHDGSVTETYQVIDSAGNEYKKMITVYIVDTTPVVVEAEGTTRFINEKYYNASYENGGLEDNSIWKTDPEYAAASQQAFANFRNDTPIRSYVFTAEEVQKMKTFIQGSSAGGAYDVAKLREFSQSFISGNRR